MDKEVVLFWFRRDLRLTDNVGLYKALHSGYEVLPIFIFDNDIIEKLPKDDARITFIYETLKEFHQKLQVIGSSLYVQNGTPLEVFQKLIQEFTVSKVFYNKDYEPYALQRDEEVTNFLKQKGIEIEGYKDQVIFEEQQILNKEGKPYTVYSPYKKQWLLQFQELKDIKDYTVPLKKSRYLQKEIQLPTLQEFGFQKSTILVRAYQLDYLSKYDKIRDYPDKSQTSYLSPYLRFGKVSVRKTVRLALHTNETFLSELIWREFFMQILYHFPHVVTQNFKSKYDRIPWRNNKEEFEKWCKGETGYPLVDAGMRELNTTGYMHNRVRMVVASFLCKHLLIDWRWGEAYFAQKLLDYDLSANNGNWQWAASTGCDAVPYFRIFNPEAQLKKFDPQLLYTRKWVKDLDELTYPLPVVPHKLARERAIAVYKKALS